MKDIVVSEKELHEICQRIGHELTERYKDNVLPPVFIGVMKGALPFMMDLIREIKCPILTDYVTISSYMGKESTGVIKLKKDIDTDLTGRDVVIVEDIIDTGITLEWFKEYLKNNYYKKCKRKVDVPVDYVGKEIGDAFIVGYGLDYDEFFRNEKEIFIPTKEQIEEIDKMNN